MHWRLRSRASVIACVLFSVEAANAIPGDDVESTLQLGQCEEHLRAVVSQLRIDAEQKGKGILVAWNTDGSVTLRYEHFAQRMRCGNGVLLVDYPGFSPLAK
jgi:hypothetical protein